MATPSKPPTEFGALHRRATTLSLCKDMIAQNEVSDAKLDACPGFAAINAEISADGDSALLYVFLGRLSDYFVTIYQSGPDSELRAAVNLIERMHTHGDDYVREAVTIGLLEGVQNVAVSRGIDLATLRAHLGPESQRWWDSLNRFWQKEIPFVGADLQSEN